jgi:thiol-disulfide isomerase/thioredoxin
MSTSRLAGGAALAALLVASLAAPFAAGAAEVRAWSRPTTPPLVFEAADGSKVDIKSPPGKVRVVNFWAAWCAPCREELPALQKYADSVKGQPVEVVLVNVGDSARVMERFARLHSVSLRSLRDSESVALYGAWGFKQLPATVVLDPQGQARWTVIGKIDEAAEPLKSRVGLLLKERPSR